MALVAIVFAFILLIIGGIWAYFEGVLLLASIVAILVIVNPSLVRRLANHLEDVAA